MSGGREVGGIELHKVGFTSQGNVLVEMSVIEWDSIAPHREVKLVESDYNVFALIELLTGIFGERFPLQATLKEDTEKQFVSLMTTTLRSLPDKEKNILELQFGLVDKPPLTVKEIAAKLNLSVGEIRKIKDKALRSLRHPYRSRALVPYTELLSRINQLT